MAPELFKGKKYSFESDVWSLGCCLYELCNFRHAFEANSINGLALKVLRGSYPKINQSYSKKLRDLTTSMLSLKRRHRPLMSEIA